MSARFPFPKTLLPVFVTNKNWGLKMRIALSLIVAITLVACATGSAIVTGAKHPPIAAEAVKLYTSPPADFDEIAIVKASSGAGLTQQASVDYAIAELKKQDAKLGANGVLLETTGTKTTTVIGSAYPGTFYAIPDEAQVLQGRAIYVTNEK